MKRGHRFDIVVAFMSSARFITSLTTSTVGASVFAFATRQTIGWVGMAGVIGILLILWAAVLIARRGEIEWNGLLPISLIVFVGWAFASVIWSEYPWASLAGILYLGAFTVFGVAIALLRDTIQIVRSFGDVLRLILASSLVVEIVSGLLIDAPIRFLDVHGDLDKLGPIQGILGTRNHLGIVAVIAIITFATELHTRSVVRGIGIGSVILASLCLLLSQSPLALGTAAILGIATLTLFGLRKVAVERRRFWQLGLLFVSVVVMAVAWVFRSPIVGAMDATADLDYRLNLWRRVMVLLPPHSLEGWGWIGAWRGDLVPFIGFQNLPGGAPVSASNAYLDVWLQLGIVGVSIFVVLVALAFVRSWLLAVVRRSVVFFWPALVLLSLIISSMAESLVLTDFAWLTLVLCTVKASRELSWRQAFHTAIEVPELPRAPR